MSTADSSGTGEPGTIIGFFDARDIDEPALRVGRGKPGALFFFAGWHTDSTLLTVAEAFELEPAQSRASWNPTDAHFWRQRA